MNHMNPADLAKDFVFGVVEAMQKPMSNVENKNSDPPT
jgi:hypothetical protein